MEDAYVCDICGEEFPRPADLGGHKAGHRNYIAETDLLEELVNLTEQLGHVPTGDEIDEHSEYSASVYKDRFGSQAEARKKADLPEYPHVRPSYPKEEILEAIQSLSVDLERPPTTIEMNQSEGPSMTAVKNHFSTWADAVRAAGLDPDLIPHGSGSWSLSSDDIAVRLQELANRLGHPPNTTEVKKSGVLSQETIYRLFDSHSDALRAAGLDPSERLSIWDSRGRYTESELIEELHRLTNQLGRPPHREDLKKHSQYSPGPFYRIFDTWGDALRAAGYEPPKKWEVTKDALIEEVHRLEEEIGRPPSYTEMESLGEYSPSSYERQFGSWNEGVEAAGLEPVGVLAGEENPNWGGGHDKSKRYGAGWTPSLKKSIRERDGYTCRDPECSMTQEQHLDAYGVKLHVHHTRNPEEFNKPEEAHTPENLITFCHYHHLSKWELLQPFVPKVVGNWAD